MKKTVFCKSCDVYEARPGVNVGECRKDPPVISEQYGRAYPIVSEDDYCGRHPRLKDQDGCSRCTEKDARIKELEKDFEAEKLHRLTNHALEERLKILEHKCKELDDLNRDLRSELAESEGNEVSAEDKTESLEIQLRQLESDLRVANHRIEELKAHPHPDTLRWWHDQQWFWNKRNKELEERIKLMGSESMLLQKNSELEARIEQLQQQNGSLYEKWQAANARAEDLHQHEAWNREKKQLSQAVKDAHNDADRFEKLFGAARDKQRGLEIRLKQIYEIMYRPLIAEEKVNQVRNLLAEPLNGSSEPEKKEE